MHVLIGSPPAHNASKATGAFGGKRAARSRVTLRRNAANGRVAGEGEDGRQIVGFAVAITSLGFGHEGAVERDLSNVRFPAPTGRSPIQVRWQVPTQSGRPNLPTLRRQAAARVDSTPTCCQRALTGTD